MKEKDSEGREPSASFFKQCLVPAPCWPHSEHWGYREKRPSLVLQGLSLGRGRGTDVKADY